MPIFKPDDIPADTPDSSPSACGPYRDKRFSDAGGLTQFGALISTLPPGSRSSIKHWHQNEDEFVYMLTGELLLHEGNTITPFLPGEAACFKAGTPQGHTLENASSADATFLIVGTRSDGDVVTYPDDDRVLAFDRIQKTRTWTDHAGRTASNPYTP